MIQMLDYLKTEYFSNTVWSYLTNIRNIFKLMHDIAASQYIVLFCLIDIFMFVTCLTDSVVTLEKISCNYASLNSIQIKVFSAHCSCWFFCKSTYVDTHGAIECSSTKGTLFRHQSFVSNPGSQKPDIIISLPTFAAFVH